MTKKKSGTAKKAKAPKRKYRKVKRRKARKGLKGDYCPLGVRIRQLGSQLVLAKALGLSQTSVSKKLRGESSLLVYDLGVLAKKFNKPMAWFFESE